MSAKVKMNSPLILLFNQINHKKNNVNSSELNTANVKNVKQMKSVQLSFYIENGEQIPRKFTYYNNY